MLEQWSPLNSKEDVSNEKKMYQKIFIARMIVHSFLIMVS